jgi:hypothetical protein
MHSASFEEVGRVTNSHFSLTADDGIDDLPRTLRREREARERAKREEEERKRRATLTHDFEPGPPAAAHSGYPGPGPAEHDAVPAVVTRFDVPFVRLMTFFIKAVFAAIPALIILGALLWLAGDVLKGMYPGLINTEVIIRVPR